RTMLQKCSFFGRKITKTRKFLRLYSFLIRSSQTSENRQKLLYFCRILRHSHLFGPKFLYFCSFFAKAICRERGAEGGTPTDGRRTTGDGRRADGRRTGDDLTEGADG
ncbi:hypothetical protein, partial [Paenibacillus cisolokensis]|uniref:hypothetical protein n=1 Tax=Paenibacillus cisolokensis TaxID=1658519 RepID=UPI001BCE972C